MSSTQSSNRSTGGAARKSKETIKDIKKVANQKAKARATIKKKKKETSEESEAEDENEPSAGSDHEAEEPAAPQTKTSEAGGQRRSGRIREIQKKKEEAKRLSRASEADKD